jgi:hypothetical protein
MQKRSDGSLGVWLKREAVAQIKFWNGLAPII